MQYWAAKAILEYGIDLDIHWAAEAISGYEIDLHIYWAAEAILEDEIDLYNHCEGRCQIWGSGPSEK